MLFGERFPQAEIHVLTDAGHYVVEDAHERIVPLMQSFLERTQESSQLSAISDQQEVRSTE